MGVGDLQVGEATRTLLDELVERWVVPYASAAHVEHSLRVHSTLIGGVFRAAIFALSHERVLAPNKFRELGTGGAEQRGGEAQPAALRLVDVLCAN